MPLPMFSLVRWIALLVLSLLLAVPSGITAEKTSEFRPALIGTGPKALTNLIDTQKLLQQGQGDAVVMFSEPVFGAPIKADLGTVYRATPNSKLLQKEILRALARAQFIPAMAHGKPTLAEFRGTVMFFANTEPHLRILANQDPAELAHLSDFISPQFLIGTTQWDPKNPQMEAARRRRKDGVVVLSFHVNAQGKVTASRLVSEDPPDLGYGPAVLKAFAHADFIPAFRNGQAVDCEFQRTQYVQLERGLRWFGVSP